MSPLFQNPGLVVADRWQRGFPLCPRPFAIIGAAHDLSEAETLTTLAGLRQNGMLSRIGAVVRPNRAGASTLAALSCPSGDIERVARLVSDERHVNHNYERQHAVNLWFVVAAPSGDELEGTLNRIRQRTGHEVLDLRLERPYHIDLGFSLEGNMSKDVNGDVAARQATAEERRLLAAIEDGLPLVAEPYAAIASALGWSEAEVLSRLELMQSAGIISRFGCVIRHRQVGYAANAMAVWDAPSSRVDEMGTRLAREPDVTLCYRRNRHRPSWPYNLFAMIHGRDEDTVRRQIATMSERAGLAGLDSDVLFSRRCFVQRGARFARAGKAAA